MIRFEYNVLKPFSIHKNFKGKRSVANTDEEKQSGMKFGLVTKYVDYESKGEMIEQDFLTHKLCKLQYLELEREVKMLKRSS